MTTEELLLKRYKVTNIWPHLGDKDYYHGEIITLIKSVNLNQYCIRRGDATLYDAFFDQYPHLFEPLPWWKDRKVEEMPEYVRSIRQEYNFYGLRVGTVVKVKEWVLLS